MLVLLKKYTKLNVDSLGLHGAFQCLSASIQILQCVLDIYQLFFNLLMNRIPLQPAEYPPAAVFDRLFLFLSSDGDFMGLVCCFFVKT